MVNYIKKNGNIIRRKNLIVLLIIICLFRRVKVFKIIKSKKFKSIVVKVLNVNYKKKMQVIKKRLAKFKVTIK